MAQFEYNDLNKFFVSIGVFLIGLTFILPWLFLREDFNLLITSENLSKFTLGAQKIIKQRQSFVGLLSVIIPIISILTLSSGTFLIYKGIRGWRKLQLLIEEREKLTNQIQVIQEQKEKLTNQKLFIEITSLSKEEKNEKIEKEVQQIQPEVSEKLEMKTALDPETFKKNYLQFENKFQLLLEKHLSANYKIYRDSKIDNSEYDLILSSLPDDFIFEIKYSEGRVSSWYLHKCLAELRTLLSSYMDKVKPNAKARLVFLLTQAAINERGVKNTDLSYKTLGLFEYENQNLRGSNIRIVYFEVEKLEVYSQNEILERLQL